jgi:hypothetical protein
MPHLSHCLLTITCFPSTPEYLSSWGATQCGTQHLCPPFTHEAPSPVSTWPPSLLAAPNTFQDFTKAALWPMKASYTQLRPPHQGISPTVKELTILEDSAGLRPFPISNFLHSHLWLHIRTALLHSHKLRSTWARHLQVS